MSFSVAINFDGNCREALAFYAEVFELPEPLFLTYGGSITAFDPNVQVSSRNKNLIMYAALDIGGTLVEFSDMPDNFPFHQGNNITLSVTYDDMITAKRRFYRLCDEGQIFIPFAVIPEQEQGHYGMCVDRFGLTWAIRSKE